MSLTTLDSSHKWNHTVSVLLWRVYFTQHHVLQVRPCYSMCEICSLFLKIYFGSMIYSYDSKFKGYQTAYGEVFSQWSLHMVLLSGNNPYHPFPEMFYAYTYVASFCSFLVCFWFCSALVFLPFAACLGGHFFIHSEGLPILIFQPHGVLFVWTHSNLLHKSSWVPSYRTCVLNHVKAPLSLQISRDVKASFINSCSMDFCLATIT